MLKSLVNVNMKGSKHGVISNIIIVPNIGPITGIKAITPHATAIIIVIKYISFFL